MHALLVHPRFPATYWGFQHSLPHIGKRAALPPLGLITLAALLPRDWSARLVDLNVGELDRADLAWADVVLAGGMHIQAPSLHDVIAAARRAGRPVVVGGPSPTTAPLDYADADIVFCGEAEGRILELTAALAAMRTGGGPVVLQSPELAPDLRDAPVPRFDLLDLSAYASVGVQYSRGCPFDCEFCDIVAIFGHVPRVKSPEQVLAELDALGATGWRGSVFFVDDNFIGNRRAVRELLPPVTRWQQEHGQPFELYTEASVNLAQDPALVAAMVEAGFASVFVGIESPSPETLRDAGKRHNAVVDLRGAVETLTRSGLEVMGGFIVGFDADDERVFDTQLAFIADLPVPLAMVGMLTALPGTALWRRLQREGRLRADIVRDQFGRPNFEPVMHEHALLDGYARLLAQLYSPAAYERRCAHFLETAPAHSTRRMRPADLGLFVRLAWRLGVRGRHRGLFWRLAARALRRSWKLLPWAITQAVKAEHMIRYTSEVVLPRLAAACSRLDRPEPIPAGRPADLASIASS